MRAASHRERSSGRPVRARPPPRGLPRRRVDCGCSVRLPVFLPEALNAAGGIDKLLLASEKRVANVADVRMNFCDRRARLERVAARALYGRGCVLGMDIGFHGNASV